MAYQSQMLDNWIFLISIGAIVTVLLAGLAMGTPTAYARANAAFPEPILNVTENDGGKQTAVFAGGCFWGVEAVFSHTRGVLSATPGYAGGAANTASYDRVSSGTTGHAEAVQVVYDPQKISYGQLLKIFFSVAHDPTQLNFQGPDHGTQYRSAIFTSNDQQARMARAYIDQLRSARIFSALIVTQVTALPAFYPAESYHHDYLAQHPAQPYIVMYDLPKLGQLRVQFPQLYH